MRVFLLNCLLGGEDISCCWPDEALRYPHALPNHIARSCLNDGRNFDGVGEIVAGNIVYANQKLRTVIITEKELKFGCIMQVWRKLILPNRALRYVVNFQLRVINL